MPHALCRVLATICFAFALGSARAEPPEPFVLADGAYRSLLPAVAILSDPEKERLAQDVAALFAAGRMKAVETPYLNMLPQKGRYWAAFALANGTGRAGRWIVDLRRPHLLELAVWIDRSDGLQRVLALPENAAFAERPLGHRYHGFPIALEAGERATVVIGYRSFATGWLAPHVGDAEAVLRVHAPEDVTNWAVNGALAAVIALSLVLVPVIGARIGLSFAAYGAAGLLFILHGDGYLTSLVAPERRVDADRVALLLGLVVTVTALLFARALFDTRRTQPRLDRLYRALGVALALFCAALPLFYGLAPYNAAAYATIVLTSLLHPLIGIVAWRQGDPASRPFLVGSPLIVGSLLYAALAHLVPGRFSIERTLDVGQVTLIVEAFAFSFAILVRTRDVRRERDAAVERAMTEANERLLLLEALGDSERRRERTSQAAERAQARLATIGHDIRQPLVSLRATLDRLGDLPGPAERRMRDAFAYMETLAAGVRDAPPEDEAEAPETFDVDIVLANAVDMFREEAAERGMTLRHEPSGREVTARPVPLMRIANNLIANAVRHSGGQEVVARASEDSEGTWLEIEDDGTSPDAATLAALRKSGAKGAGSEGDGLGLAIVEDLAAQEGRAFELRRSAGGGTLARLGL